MAERYWNVGDEFLEKLADSISEECREAARQAVIESWKSQRNFLGVADSADEEGKPFALHVFFLTDDEPCFDSEGEIKTVEFPLIEELREWVVAPYDVCGDDEKIRSDDKNFMLKRLEKIRKLASDISAMSDELEKQISEAPERD